MTGSQEGKLTNQFLRLQCRQAQLAGASLDIHCGNPYKQPSGPWALFIIMLCFYQSQAKVRPDTYVLVQPVN